MMPPLPTKYCGMISHVTVFGRAEFPAFTILVERPDRNSTNRPKKFFGRGSPCLNRQQDLNSPSYYGERRCDEFAINSEN